MNWESGVWPTPGCSLSPSLLMVMLLGVPKAVTLPPLLIASIHRCLLHGANVVAGQALVDFVTAEPTSAKTVNF